MDRTVPKGLFIVVLIGLIFVLGPLVMHSIVNSNVNYINTTGKFVEAERRDIDSSMSYLIYEYHANGQIYRYKTNYATSIIPKKGSEIKLKYDEEDPYNVYFVSFGLFQMIGLFMVFIPLIMLFGKMTWLRDVLMFIFTGTLILTFVSKGFSILNVIGIGILLLLNFVSIIDFIKCIVSNNFNPKKDIKEEKEKSRIIKGEKERKKHLKHWKKKL